MNMNGSNLDNYTIFEEEVRRHFRFLDQQYGFKLSQVVQDGRVKVIRYESPSVYVALYYGPPAYEPEIAFGRIGIDDAPGAYSFNQGDLVMLNSTVNLHWNADDPSHLSRLLSYYARLLRECGSACLRGEQAVYVELKAVRDRAVQVWRRQEQVNSVRKEAEYAWRRRDYAVVVRLYETIRNVLTKSEDMKLQYAKKQLGDHGPTTGLR